MNHCIDGLIACKSLERFYVVYLRYLRNSYIFVSHQVFHQPVQKQDNIILIAPRLCRKKELIALQRQLLKIKHNFKNSVHNYNNLPLC